MSDRIAAEGYGEDPLPDDDEEEMHWALERLGQASVYLVLGSLGVAVLGLATLAANPHVSVVSLAPLGKTFVAAGSIGAMGSMSLATVVATASGTFSPF